MKSWNLSSPIRPPMTTLIYTVCSTCSVFFYSSASDRRIMTAGCPSVDPCMIHASVRYVQSLLARIRSQWTKFHQTLLDDVVEWILLSKSTDQSQLKVVKCEMWKNVQNVKNLWTPYLTKRHSWKCISLPSEFFLQNSNPKLYAKFEVRNFNIFRVAQRATPKNLWVTWPWPSPVFEKVSVSCPDCPWEHTR